MSMGEIQNILHSKPTRHSVISESINIVGFEGDDNEINIAVSDGKLKLKSFNSPLFLNGKKFDLR